MAAADSNVAPIRMTKQLASALRSALMVYNSERIPGEYRASLRNRTMRNTNTTRRSAGTAKAN